MKYAVPIHAVIEAKSDAEAEVAAKKMNELLSQPMTRMMIQAQGIDLQRVVVGTATQVRS